MDLRWEDDFTIKVETCGDALVIRANRAGLRSLANHLVALAEEVPGSHIHFDEHNSLEDGSVELIVELEE